MNKPADKNLVLKKRSRMLKLAALGGGIFGALAGRYAGMAIAYPGFLFLLSFFIMKKFLIKNRKVFFTEVSSLLFAHAGWLASGLILTCIQNRMNLTQFTAMNISEISVYLLLGVIISAGQQKHAVIITIIIETILSGFNIFQIISLQTGTGEHKTLTVHLIIRTCIILYAVLGLRKQKKHLLEMRQHIL
ncbi:MAG: hypothetical protein JW982_11515 [Spirochaetes bacterium]|nr:hypothetical protein [Spirochaetota bacterium]